MKQILVGIILLAGIFANAENIKLVAAQNIQVDAEQKVLPGLGYYFNKTTGETLAICDMNFEPKPFKRQISKNASFALNTVAIKEYKKPEMTRTEMQEALNAVMSNVTREIKLPDDIVTEEEFKNYMYAELMGTGVVVEYFNHYYEYNITSEKTENSFTLKCRAQADTKIGLKELLNLLEEGGALVPANDM